VAEEKVNSVVTALSATTISGYVDTSAQWNFGTGDAHLPDYKFGGASKADGFNFNVVQLRIEKPMSEEEWAAGYRVTYGLDRTPMYWGHLQFLASSANDIAVRQAFVALRIPYQNWYRFQGRSLRQYYRL